MKLLIAGSRSIKEFDLSPYVPKETELIISGGAEGVDRIAEEYADTHRMSNLILRPRYELYGRAAPLKRNEKMIEIADAVLVVWDGASRGARYTMEYAKKKNKPLTVVEVGKAPPLSDEIASR